MALKYSNTDFYLFFLSDSGRSRKQDVLKGSPVSSAEVSPILALSVPRKSGF